MIVAHPDDETLWGGGALDDCPPWTWHIICCTEPRDTSRVEKFSEALSVLAATGQILPIEDSTEQMKDSDLSAISQATESFARNNKVVEILTHGRRGEYGHPRHVELSKFVRENLAHLAPVYEFHLGERRERKYSWRRNKALEIYFGVVEPGTDSFRFLRYNFIFDRTLKAAIRLVKSCFALMLSSKSDFRQIQRSDLMHIETSEFVTFKNSASIRDQTKEDFIVQGAQLKSSPGEVFSRNPKLFMKYQDRRFLILDFLPSCNGKTLSVGCHSYNEWDFLASGNPSGYMTVDICPDYEQFGSPFWHRTIDFLDIDAGIEVDNIILFGVLGIPTDKTRDKDDYTLFDRFEDVILKADQMLRIGGRLLLGPDLKLGSSRSFHFEANRWMDIILKNAIIKRSFVVNYRLVTPTNLILVMTKFC